MRRSASLASLACLLLLLLLLLLIQPCLSATTLEPRNPTSESDPDYLPSAVSVAPDQWWGGIDGAWSTFAIHIGQPAHYARVLVSTASQQTWAIHRQACEYNETDPDTQEIVTKRDDDCYDSRGYTFNLSASKTWHERGFYQLWTEKNLGLIGNGLYGFDEVGLGMPGEEGPVVKNVTVGTLVTENFWLGHIGVNPKPTNFSAFDDPSPSFMTYLFRQKQIPSVAFGYTAGVRYREAIVLGSLTLGGYDASRFLPNDITFGFAPDNERDLVVGVVGITAQSATKSNVDLMRKRQPFTMYIDSTIAELWLPGVICDLFADAFGLKWDDATKLYLVDDLLHQTLLADNPSVTFTLGQKAVTDATVNITLPYAAFDLEASPPYRGLSNTTRYFPIRRAEKESQFVLGRTFLQEAYLIVDWERQNFSVSPCSWDFHQTPTIVPIYSTSYAHLVPSPSSPPKQLSRGAIIGMAVGGGFMLAMVLFAVIWCFWRSRQKKRLASIKAEYEKKAAEMAKVAPAENKADDATSPTEEEGSNVFPKAELYGTAVGTYELGSEHKDGSRVASPTAEAENTERPVFEMLGDLPTSQEADGRQLSEKESMMVRERMYNGVDPSGPPAVSPLAEEPPPMRRCPLSPSEVTMVRRRMPDVSPTTPSPRARQDGFLLDANDSFFQPPPPRAPRDGRFLEAEDFLLSPISPLEGPTASRRRFSYEA